MTSKTDKFSIASSEARQVSGRLSITLGTADNDLSRLDKYIGRPKSKSTLKTNLPEEQGREICFRQLGSLRYSNGANLNCECTPSFVEPNSLRLLNGGARYLLDAEILELLFFDILDVGDTRKLASQFLREFGNLGDMFFASEHKIKKIEGATQEVFIRLCAVKEIALRMSQAKVLEREVVSCWQELINYCHVAMAHQSKEQFRVFYLDKRNAIISDEEQAEGTIDHVPVYPRELAKRALELDASAVILVHNHPSGDLTPSPEDLTMTKSVINACEAIGVTVHDHIIIGKNGVFSFRANGHL